MAFPSPPLSLYPPFTPLPHASPPSGGKRGFNSVAKWKARAVADGEGRPEPRPLHRRPGRFSEEPQGSPSLTPAQVEPLSHPSLPQVHGLTSRSLHGRPSPLCTSVAGADQEAQRRLGTEMPAGGERTNRGWFCWWVRSSGPAVQGPASRAPPGAPGPHTWKGEASVSRNCARPRGQALREVPQPRWRWQKQGNTKSIHIFRKLTFSKFYTPNRGLVTCTISERGKGGNH